MSLLGRQPTPISTPPPPPSPIPWVFPGQALDAVEQTGCPLCPRQVQAHSIPDVITQLLFDTTRLMRVCQAAARTSNYHGRLAKLHTAPIESGPIERISLGRSPWAFRVLTTRLASKQNHYRGCRGCLCPVGTGANTE